MVVLNGNIEGEYPACCQPTIFALLKKYILMKKEPSASKNISKNKQSGVSDARSSNGASLGLAN
jgi:hypothetical protein